MRGPYSRLLRGKMIVRELGRTGIDVLVDIHFLGDEIRWRG